VLPEPFEAEPVDEVQGGQGPIEVAQDAAPRDRPTEPVSRQVPAPEPVPVPVTVPPTVPTPATAPPEATLMAVATAVRAIAPTLDPAARQTVGRVFQALAEALLAGA